MAKAVFNDLPTSTHSRFVKESCSSRWKCDQPGSAGKEMAAPASVARPHLQGVRYQHLVLIVDRSSESQAHAAHLQQIHGGVESKVPVPAQTADKGSECTSRGLAAKPSCSVEEAGGTALGVTCTARTPCVLAARLVRGRRRVTHHTLKHAKPWKATRNGTSRNM